MPTATKPQPITEELASAKPQPQPADTIAAALALLTAKREQKRAGDLRALAASKDSCATNKQPAILRGKLDALWKQHGPLLDSLADLDPLEVKAAGGTEAAKLVRAASSLRDDLRQGLARLDAIPGRIAGMTLQNYRLVAQDISNDLFAVQRLVDRMPATAFNLRERLQAWEKDQTKGASHV